MKKRLSYRDKLIDLANIYDVREIKDYFRRRKNLTTGQLELILRKNKIVIPKDFKLNFFKENITKPLLKISKQIHDIKNNFTKAINITARKIIYLKEDSSRSISSFLYNTWKSIGNVGIAFLNMMPKLGQTYYSFFANSLTNLFHAIYNQKINSNKANRAVIGFFIFAGITAVVISGVTTFKESTTVDSNKIVKKEDKLKKEKSENKKIETKKLEVKKQTKKLKIQKKEKVVEVVIPNLNLKTETVLTLFKNVDYDLNKVRYEKTVKPIYFTQFPSDLDEILNVKLKKETFIKIVLPLIVAENEKILEDRYKLNKITAKRSTTDVEKQWLRQKFLIQAEYENLSDKIYIDRSDSLFNHCKIINSDQVWEFLKKKGFTKIKLTEINFRNQIGLFNSANMIIGAHGAGLSNMIFSNPNTNVIEFQPKNYPNEFFPRVSEINSLNYNKIISKDLKFNTDKRPGDILVDLKDIERLLD